MWGALPKKSPRRKITPGDLSSKNRGLIIKELKVVINPSTSSINKLGMLP